MVGPQPKRWESVGKGKVGWFSVAEISLREGEDGDQLLNPIRGSPARHIEPVTLSNHLQEFPFKSLLMQALPCGLRFNC